MISKYKINLVEIFIRIVKFFVINLDPNKNTYNLKLK